VIIPEPNQVRDRDALNTHLKRKTGVLRSRQLLIFYWRAENVSIEKPFRGFLEGITPKAVWHVVKAAAKRSGIKGLAPHDLRRTCARLCHVAGGELDQIQFVLGHASVQTTERYLGCKQKLRHAVNDNMGIKIS
jgi:integrase